MAPAQTYLEIEQLEDLIKLHSIEVETQPGIFLTGDESYTAVKFRIGNHIHELFVFDEYDDLELNNPPLSLCLVLRELETYRDAEDFLVWCKEQGLEPGNDAARSYHMGLNSIYKRVIEVLGPIDSALSDLDFQLNSGAAQYLRSSR